MPGQRNRSMARLCAQSAAELIGQYGSAAQMSQSARQLVDGKGRERVLEMMQTRDASCA